MTVPEGVVAGDQLLVEMPEAIEAAAAEAAVAEAAAAEAAAAAEEEAAEAEAAAAGASPKLRPSPRPS